MTRLAPTAARLVAAAALAAWGGTVRAESYDCLMDPAEVVELGSAVSGILEEVMVGRGDEVRAGQLVARVNATVETAAREVLALRAASEAKMNVQRARLRLAESRMERAEKLLARGVTTKDAMEGLAAERDAGLSLLEEAQMEFELARRELARAEAVIRLREIRSPVDGVVQERRLTAGEYVHQDTHVATIVKLDPLHVVVYLPVERFTDVRKGDAAVVRPAAPVEGAFEAEVDVVDRVFDAASGTFGVRLVLPNPDGALPGGHRCEVEFDFEPTN